ncbi:hypothetical protein BGW80DRAFT_1438779 [Lactifluus volemus]|nr:hypothetical protein BGW80DRAFT_1438779 [Lactifluus volemus]
MSAVAGPPSRPFTRRKRWADLLITELSEAILLVLSPSRKVLFCNPADLIDRDLTNLVLLEIIGYPHFVPGETECSCFFVVAKPFPSRNTAMLNTLLELKVENERLQQHIRVLRAHSQQVSAGQVTQHLDPYAADDMSAQLAANLGLPARSTLGGDPSRPHYSSISHGYEAGNFPAVLEDDGDSEPRRKKAILKSLGGEQYICNTCGRTDSPEWRKGPRGPKTLCNACGLRWAKKVRKFEEAAEAGDISQLPLDDTVPP